MAQEQLKLPLSSFLIDPDIQSRVAGLDEEHLASLEETPDDWPPVQAIRKGSRYLLVAGHHRYAAAQNIGLAKLAVEVIEPPADGDIRGLNFASNLTHGKPPTRADKRAECARLLLLHPEWSDREVGRRCQLSQPTVAKVRSELEESAQLSSPAVRVGRGGYTYVGPDRRPGDLPPAGITELVGELGSRLFSGKERLTQRRIASYLGRLATALDDQGDLLADPHEAAQALQLVLGSDAALALARRLDTSASAVVSTARASLAEAGQG